MKKLSLQVGDGWTRDPQSLLMPKFIEDGWEVHYIGDKRGIEHQRDPQVGSRCHLPFHCDWKIASLFLLAKYAGCI